MLLLLWACAGEPGPATGDEPVALWGEVAAAKVEEGEPVQLTVFLREAEAWSAERGEPEAAGLELREVEALAPVTVPGGQLNAWRYELRGPAGSYVIRPGSAQAEGPGGQQQQVEGAPIFVDIGVQGPRSPVSDFEAVPVEASPPWALLALAGLGLGALGLTVLILRRRPAPPPPPPLAPHEQALQDWRRQRAAGLLDATDRLKFAREGGGASFFAELDEDFEAIIEATRPAGGEPR